MSKSLHPRIDRKAPGRVVRLAALAIALLTAGPAAAQLSFGVVPQQSASELARLWTPILVYLNEKTSLKLEFHTAKDIPTFEQRLAHGEYDFAYMNPYHYAVFHDFSGYQAFAKEKGRRLVGLIVVRKNNPLASIADLNQREIALPAPAAFAASMLPYAALRSKGISVKPRYVSSHDSVYLAVVKGIFPAGGGIARTFENLDPGLHDQLRVLWKTRAYTPHAIAAHPRVKLESVKQLRAALIAMGEEPRGAALLKAIGFAGVTVARDRDYDDVRALKIGAPQYIGPGN